MLFGDAETGDLPCDLRKKFEVSAGPGGLEGETEKEGGPPPSIFSFCFVSPSTALAASVQPKWGDTFFSYAATIAKTKEAGRT